MKEIGSEFWTCCTPLDGDGIEPLLPKGFNTRFTLSGRTGLEIIVSDIIAVCNHSLTVYMPSYCCHTMIEPFARHGVKIEFYDILLSKNGIKKCFDVNNGCDIVFLMDYFGYIDSETIEIAKEQKERNKIVIYDATQSVFCYNMDYSHYDYVFGSFRKWFGVNAGFCSKKTHWIYIPELCQNYEYTSLRNISFEMKADYMAGKDVDKQIFLKNFGELEEKLEIDYLNYAPDEKSLRTILTINTDFLRNRRRDNAKILINSFDENKCIVSSIFHSISEQDCPLFVPVDIQSGKRDALRQHLIKNNCYLPVHWPVSCLHRISNKSIYMYDHELSCVCDQRYDKDDIGRLIEVINDFND